MLAWVEGISLLLLLFVAMPVKYGLGYPGPVRVVGMAHGLLFLAFVYALTVVGRSRDFSWRTIALGYASAVLPFATFFYDRRYLAAVEGKR